MTGNSDDVLLAAVVGLVGWFVKDFLFTIVQRRDQLERTEWEYRLKEVYCPLYLWSGMLAMRLPRELRYNICSRVQDIMAKAAYVIPQQHFYTVVRLLESAYEQGTTAATAEERNSMRAYLYGQIQVFNFVLYRSDETGGIGDPTSLTGRYKRLFRLLLLGIGHLLVWLVIAGVLGLLVWGYQQQHFTWLAVVAVGVLLGLTWINKRARHTVQKGIAQRMAGERPK